MRVGLIAGMAAMVTSLTGCAGHLNPHLITAKPMQKVAEGHYKFGADSLITDIYEASKSEAQKVLGTQKHKHSSFIGYSELSKEPVITWEVKKGGSSSVLNSKGILTLIYDAEKTSEGVFNKREYFKNGSLNLTYTSLKKDDGTVIEDRYKNISKNLTGYRMINTNEQKSFYKLNGFSQTPISKNEYNMGLNNGYGISNLIESLGK